MRMPLKMAAVSGDVSSLKFDSKTKLTLADIKTFGGEEGDLELINSDDDEDDLEEIVKDDDSDSDDEPLSKFELRDFVKKLKFKEISNKVVIIKDEEVQDVAAGEDTVEKKDDAQEVKVNKTKKEKKMERDAKYNLVGKEPLKSTSKGPSIERKHRNYMLAKPEVKWFENEVSIQATDINFAKVDLPKVMEFENYAAKLLFDDIELYKKYQRNSKNRSNFHWIQTVLKSGTTADKMAAYIVLVQDSPVHNLSCLEQLIKMVDVRRKGECLMAIDTLKDLFIGDLLLENKKLHSFDQQPLGGVEVMSAGNSDAYEKLLLLWHFESCLKQKYSDFVSAIVKISHDTVDTYKRRALKAMFELLLKNPEQEQTLLNNIVNKLGDPNHKVASQTSYFLCRLLDKHPTMKSVIVNEVERLLFRPNISSKASYFAVCFLNQIILDAEDKMVAAKLTTIYFSLFRASTKKGEVDTKMMTALLTGANRSFPFAKLDSAAISEHIDATYKLVPTMNFNIGIQALTLLYHVLDSKDDFSDRFYSSLYRKLLDPELKSTSKQTIFINLLYKSLKRDYSEPRMQAFIKRIFQIAGEQTPAMTCGLLYLVSEVLRQSSRSLTLTHKENRWNDDDGEEELHDVEEEKDEDGTPKNESLKEAEMCKSNSVSWVHRALLHPNNKDPVTKNDKVVQDSYDPLHRNPLYAIVGNVCPWELTKLSNHYHPSVALFANTLLNGEFIKYSGDPLQDFTLTRFLDRFVYRNPKKATSLLKDEAGEEIKPITAQRSILGKRSLYKPKGARALPVISNTYANKPEDTIPVDEQFMYKYLMNKRDIEAVGAAKKKDEEDDDDEDVESVSSDEFDNFLDKFNSGDIKDEYEIDFAAQFKKGLVEKEGKKSKRGKTESDDEDSSDEDDDDEEVDFEGNDFDDAFKDFDEEIEEAKAEVEDSEDEISDLEDSDTEVKKKDKTESGDDDEEDEFPQRPKRRRQSEEDTKKLFASAEEFASVLEENSTGKAGFIGLEAFANKDNAHLKQLKWEADRDKWVRGVDWKSKKRSAPKQKLNNRSFKQKLSSRSFKDTRKNTKFVKRKGPKRA